MLEILFSWGIILTAALLFGYGAVFAVYKDKVKQLVSLDIYVISGLMLLNIYAEIFSVFYKVGIMACFILALLGLGVFIFILVKDKNGLAALGKRIFFKPYYFYLIFIICVLATAAWTVLTPAHYDTALYHAQAVRWIEEYGVVPGLGNLHNRFAYNSAFMPLQALFSFEWLFDRSLHTLNGFICCVMLIWAISTNHLLAGKKLQLSDFFKGAAIVYICINKQHISSLSSDILAMLLVIYIFAKWSELLEQNVDDSLPYAFYCILSVWAVTVKLSTVTGILLAVYPIILILRKKEYQKIVIHLLVGFLAAVPWLIRNVIISGYLIFPYSELDFFNVDWKMPSYIVNYDKMEIAVWGRGVKQVELYRQPVWEWIGQWYFSQSLFEQALIVFGGSSAIILVGYLIYKIYSKDVGYSILYAAAIAGLAAWFFSAPLLRYGSMYLMIPVCVISEKIYRRKAIVIKGICGLILIPVFCAYIAQIEDLNGTAMIKQEDYQNYATYKVSFNNMEVWIPENGDRAGYHAFPSTPHENRLGLIELRGRGLEEGFRVKEELKNASDEVLKEYY